MLGVLLAGCASVSPTPSASLPVTSSATAAASSTAAATAPPPLDLAAGTWWSSGGWNDNTQDVQLQVGLLDGTRTTRVRVKDAWVARTNVPIVRGPAKGLVLYGRIVAEGIELHLVSAFTGVDRAALTVPSTADDAEVAPAGDIIYWIDRAVAGGGVWRADLAAGTRTQILAPLEVAAVQGGIVLAAAIEPRAELALSADGSKLAAMWCGRQGCLLQVVKLGDDAVQGARIPEVWHDLLGFADDGVALAGVCVDPVTQGVRNTECEHPDARARVAELQLSFALAVELPPGWTFDLIPDPNAPPMSFQLQAVAVPAGGGDPVTLEVLGPLSGQG